jgi:hypothetical protein
MESSQEKSLILSVRVDIRTYAAVVRTMEAAGMTPSSRSEVIQECLGWVHDKLLADGKLIPFTTSAEAQMYLERSALTPTTKSRAGEQLRRVVESEALPMPSEPSFTEDEIAARVRDFIAKQPERDAQAADPFSLPPEMVDNLPSENTKPNVDD